MVEGNYLCCYLIGHTAVRCFNGNSTKLGVLRLKLIPTLQVNSVTLGNPSLSLRFHICINEV